MKKIINVQQGSTAWHQHRSTHYNASEAAAAMGLSRYTSRSDLLSMKASGYVPEVDAATQRRFDDGHANEAAARPWAEEIIGQELYPVTLAAEVEGLNLSASLDGLTMDDDIAFEHKTLNAALEESLEDGVIPDEYHPQMEQCLLISGAEKCLFMASKDGSRETMLYAWYKHNPDVRKALLAGWRQFDEDVANYQPRESEPEVVGRAPDQLPALRIEVKGAVTASNLESFREHAMAVFQGINTELSTDADFANAEKTAKWCKDVETKLDGAKEQALAQTASIDDLFRAIDSIKEEARATRLTLERSVKSRKEQIRREIITEAREALQAHAQKINASLDVQIPAPSADFAGAIKGKRTISSLRDATDTLLAQSKIQANELADLVRANLKVLDDAGHAHLFADRAQLALRDTDYVKGIVSTRIIEHEQAEARRLEAERERIRAEEEAKARRAAEEQRQADLRDQEAQARIAAAETAKPEEPNPPKARPEASKAHQPQTASVKQPAKRTRPTDAHIIGTLAECFRVHESKVHEWILAMDHKAIEKWILEEFAA